MPKIVRPKLPSRKTLVAQLDSLFSLRIKLRDKRLRYGCPFHTDPARHPATQCFHFITRSKQCVRWDERNAVASCAGCNIRYEHDQTFVDQVMTWYKTTFGQAAWAQLVFDSHTPSDFGRTDLVELRDRLRANLEQRPAEVGLRVAEDKRMKWPLSGPVPHE